MHVQRTYNVMHTASIAIDTGLSIADSSEGEIRHTPEIEILGRENQLCSGEGESLLNKFPDYATWW